jgi:hypothetical protein
LIIEEGAADQPGREMILERLLEIMLIECLRWPGAGLDTVPAGLLAGVRDKALARVLGAMRMPM